ncbi:MAG: hypothetical protein ACXVB1_16075, partial [Pseudobdellovibrionaceae bacterium]
VYMLFLKWLPFMQLGGSQICNSVDPVHENGWIPLLQLGGSRFVQFSNRMKKIVAQWLEGKENTRREWEPEDEIA